MERLIVLLRAINVGKRQMVMADLRAMAAACGYGDPRTYLASGNLVVTADRTALERDFSAAVEGRFGFAVDFVVRSADELADILAFDPFPEAIASTPSRVWIMFSQDAQKEDAAERLAERAFEGETLRQDVRAVWLHAVEGIGMSKITPTAIDKACGSPTTLRNVRTVRALIELAR